MSSEARSAWLDDMTRREALRRAIAGGAALSASGLLAACGGSDSSGGGGGAGTGRPPRRRTQKLRTGGVLRIGATGGGAKDTIDAHLPTTDPDIMRQWNLYESLAVRTPDFGELADARRRVDRARRQQARRLDGPPQGRRRVPQRQDGRPPTT